MSAGGLPAFMTGARAQRHLVHTTPSQDARTGYEPGHSSTATCLGSGANSRLP